MTRRIRYYGPAVAVFVGVLGLWELAVRALGIQQFLLPPPSSIGSAFAEHFDELITVGRNTLVEAVGGLLIGGVTALIVALRPRDGPRRAARCFRSRSPRIRCRSSPSRRS